jgi:predicted MFS family arabinose efflux permease
MQGAKRMVVATAEAGSKPAAAWGAVLSMALCVAMLIASEFMPVSLLTPMAEGLRATEGQTGQAIAISGLFAVAASMVITTAAGTLNRKWVLVAMTAFMLVSLVLVAAAPNFAVLMIGRALLGICIVGFWSLATAVIMRRRAAGSPVDRRDLHRQRGSGRRWNSADRQRPPTAETARLSARRLK